MLRTPISSIWTALARRSIVITRSAAALQPQKARLLPSDMLLSRNASTAAALQRSVAPHLTPNALSVEEDLSADTDSRPLFSSLHDKLHKDTLRAIKHTHMSVVQARIFPLLPALAQPHDPNSTSKGPRDLLVKAKTGTGKTMAFLVPAIESRVASISSHVAAAKLDSGLGDKWSRIDEQKAVRAYAMANVGTLVISPTRELATQIAVEAANLSVHHPGFQVQVLLGGESRGRQIGLWERGRKDVVVATPGRLMDLMDSEPGFAEALKGTRILVLDEADTLLDMGFRDDIERISARLPRSPHRQTFLFSATVSKPIQSIAQTLLSPQHTFVNCVSSSDTATHTHIPQHLTILPSGADALPHVLRLIVHDQLLCKNEGRKSKVIVFLSTTKMTELFADMLNEAAYTGQGRKSYTSSSQHSSAINAPPPIFPLRTKTYEMHAKRDMSKRIQVSNSFRSDVASDSGAVLITSDVSARGVDYPGVTRVIQLGVPPSPDMYVHRLGRTGRGGDAGGKGRGDLVISDWEVEAVKRIERTTGGKMGRVSVEETEKECLELLEASMETKKALAAGRVGTYTPAALAEIPSFSATITNKLADPHFVPYSPRRSSAPAPHPNAVASDAVSGAFLALLGFHVGRTKDTGLRGREVAEGLQRWFGEMFGLGKTLGISQKLREALGGDGGGRGGDRGRGGFGGRGASRERSFGGAGRDGRGGYGGEGRGGYEGESRPTFGSSYTGGYGASAPRGSTAREGYRQREGGSFGYSASSSRGFGADEWSGGSGRGGTAGGGGFGTRSRGARAASREGGSYGERSGGGGRGRREY